MIGRDSRWSIRKYTKNLPYHVDVVICLSLVYRVFLARHLIENEFHILFCQISSLWRKLFAFCKQTGQCTGKKMNITISLKVDDAVKKWHNI